MLAACPLFTRATAEQLLELARLAREEPLAEGAVLFDAGDQPAIVMLLEGDVLLEAGPGVEPLEAGAGDTLGACEALAGVRSGRRARVTRAGVALRLERDELLELLEGRVDMLQGVFAALLERDGRAAGQPTGRRNTLGA
jgi:hypothetical protein